MSKDRSPLRSRFEQYEKPLHDPHMWEQISGEIAPVRPVRFRTGVVWYAAASLLLCMYVGYIWFNASFSSHPSLQTDDWNTIELKTLPSTAFETLKHVPSIPLPTIPVRDIGRYEPWKTGSIPLASSNQKGTERIEETEISAFQSQQIKIDIPDIAQKTMRAAPYTMLDQVEKKDETISPFRFSFGFRLDQGYLILTPNQQDIFSLSEVNGTNAISSERLGLTLTARSIYALNKTTDLVFGLGFTQQNQTISYHANNILSNRSRTLREEFNRNSIDASFGIRKWTGTLFGTSSLWNADVTYIQALNNQKNGVIINTGYEVLVFNRNVAIGFQPTLSLDVFNTSNRLYDNRFYRLGFQFNVYP